MTTNRRSTGGGYPPGGWPGFGAVSAVLLGLERSALLAFPTGSIFDRFGADCGRFRWFPCIAPPSFYCLAGRSAHKKTPRTS